MSWKHSGAKDVHDAVNRKSKGLADELLAQDTGTHKVQNLDVLAGWIRHYVSNPRMNFFIVGDYDADGVTATSELWLLLRRLGAANVMRRIPRRPEGFGMSEKIIEEFNETGRKGVIITVDNGIAALEPVRLAKKHGYVVLVTDHHQPVVENGRTVLPEADLIVDPHADDSLIAKGPVIGTDFRDYCGAGIVCRLASLLLADGDPVLERIYAMAAIGTVADVVPLVGDNRNIYRRGIRAIASGMVTTGLREIVRLVNPGMMITEGDIAFRVAPMLNAPGRLIEDGAEIAVNALLTEGDYALASHRAEELSEINLKRREKKEEALKRAYRIIDDEALYGVNPVVVYDPLTEEGIIGLVAGDITEKMKVCSIVFTDSHKEGVVKGSGRAPDYINLKEKLDELNAVHPEYFAGYGGHAGAAGVSVKKEYLSDFAEGLAGIMEQPKAVSDDIEYDLEVDPADLKQTIDEIQRYAPFGMGNPPIVIKVSGFKLCPVNSMLYQTLGETGIKFSGAGCTAVGFGLRDAYEKMRSPAAVDFVGTASYSYFRDRCTPQVEMMDLRPAAEKPAARPGISSSLISALQAGGLMMP